MSRVEILDQNDWADALEEAEDAAEANRPSPGENLDK